ncbi:MAG: hypothetical protein F9K24_20450 [Leptonema illini]|uniref:Uncharacterized protein n=1 Tax=Leptonema illini TaxID=183 RepID=A0A833GXX7_9LEPT|nr:MAG: hypothetical protein F9K24_20450 [Leptonema illini]
MSRFTFEQRCRPQGIVRVTEAVGFLKAMQNGLGFTELRDEGGNIAELTESHLNALIASKLVGQQFPTIGGEVHLWGERGGLSARLEFRTGVGQGEKFPEYFVASLDSGMELPSVQFLEESIKNVKPYEAFVSEAENEDFWNSYDREFSVAGKFEKPALIRWFHYFDEKVVKALGGFDHCLQAPVWDARRFNQGVILQLTERPTEMTKATGREIQRRVMDFFSLENLP